MPYATGEFWISVVETAGLAVPEGVADLGFLEVPFVAAGLDLGAMTKAQEREGERGEEVGGNERNGR